MSINFSSLRSRRIGRQSDPDYSAGQKKKVALCSALVTEVPILLLDEPFSGGLDPSGILTLKRIIQHRATVEIQRWS